MMYSAFARYYDQLTGNISYEQRASYFDGIIKDFGAPGPILLDLACGTGSLSLAFAEKGYDVIGVDASPEMLSVAMEKKLEQGRDVLFLCQDMCDLDLYGTVDVTVCALDSLNHLPCPEQVQAAFRSVSLFTAPGGLFLFDVNSPYKQRQVLGNNTFVYDCDEVYCVWQNSYDIEQDSVHLSLDFFQYDEEEDCYRRQSEDFWERTYEPQWLQQELGRSGFELLALYADDSRQPPQAESQRLIFVARKLPPQHNKAQKE